MEHLAAVLLRRAQELKEEGNMRFQNKDYRGAMENYEQALRLIPHNHPDRAIFHSNRAACLMQMKPVQYEAVVRECTLALEARPCFARALFRRARAFEALGKPEIALQDVQLLLQIEANNSDAFDMARRLRASTNNKEECHREWTARGKPSCVSPASLPQHPGTSPAALGASVVNGCPMAGKGPPKILGKKKGGKLDQPYLRTPSDSRQNSVSSLDGKQGTMAPSSANGKFETEQKCEEQPPMARGMKISFQSKPMKVEAQKANTCAKHEGSNEPAVVTRISAAASGDTPHSKKQMREPPMRQLKLIYDHDIRFAKIPIGCTIKELRSLVQKRFPSSKSVLIKYRDVDGDLITLTSTEELRLAESTLETVAIKRKYPSDTSSGNALVSESSRERLLTEPLRLHIVEVPVEQEPIFEDDEEHVSVKGVDGGSEITYSNSHEECVKLDALPLEKDSNAALICKRAEVLGKSSEGSSEKDDSGSKVKETEMDDWLVDFAQLFRTHVGVDPDVHIDLHEVGMELCSEALEETVTSEDAQPFFDGAACKFQEVAALAFFNWGNVYMCAARKRIPLGAADDSNEYQKRLQLAYVWAQGHYEKARLKYEEALKVKPDFYEGVLALGQERFESAKLRWSFAMANQVDLTSWDSSETLDLFRKAEEKMQIAFGMWEKLEEVRLEEAKSGHPVVRREGLKGHRETLQEISEAEAKEQFLVMRFQINLFWGNILFEHSQVECKLGLPSWKLLLDEAVKKFELAGASPSDIAVVMNNHVSNSTCSCQVTQPIAGEVAHAHVFAKELRNKVGESTVGT
ncbi:hypothetical protein KP509_16G075100 [Ceratopteris richardii]|nr:hypothetical protein KP509_16G075100 [Ceratopteris richardii]